MTTTPLTSTAQSSSTPSATSNASLNLKPTDFINMLVTQLKNQDPLSPTSNQDLLSQISQIGQLQSSTSLQTTLQGVTQQSQIGSASALIGKKVHGLDANSNKVNGVVTSVKVTSAGANLQLDSGSELPLANVTSIAQAA